ncbi:hypothetical protein QLX52_09550 [Streptomyces albus]|uniref:hypothetical protein n=1 Tax=Streptomyces albus TaxID=1888 RepID=UPI0024ADD890|nr:hypothetical protein [Streptomyces albus]MDI6409083.1 hypothetical protein [Streptomyces albus]
MSRETDSSSSGPKRRGGSAYPSGTEPYGTSASGTDQDGRTSATAAGAKPDEPKTETTLTTRIRINIPGSRPIPPVVMRTPVSDENDGGKPGRAEKGTAKGAKGAGATPDLSAGKRATGPAAVSPLGSGNGTAPGGTSPAAPASPASAAPTAPAQSPAAGGAGAADGGAGKPSGGGSAAASAAGSSGGEEKFTQPTSDWFAPRKPPRSTTSTPGTSNTPSARPSSASAPSAPGGDGGPAQGPEATGTHSVPGAPGAGAPYAGGSGLTDTPVEGVPRIDPGGPAGPTTGPVTGDMTVPGSGPLAAPGDGPGPGSRPEGYDDSPTGTHAAPGQDVPGAPVAPGAGSASGASGLDAFDRGPGSTPPQGTPVVPGPGRPDAGQDEPAVSSTLGLGTGPVTIPPRGGTGPDATRPGGTGSPGGGAARMSSDTMVSGVPQAGPDSGPGTPASGPSAAAPAPSGAKGAKGGKPAAKKRGRSKPALLGIGVVVVLGVAYGTGLLLDHADVPKGTTVLGVEIGGLTKHEAVNKLDAALGERTEQPFKIRTDAGSTELKPAVAGITFDTEGTVRQAAGRDYNPVSVIGSLFGQGREAEPAIKVDDAKVRAALKPVLAGTETKSPSEGMVKFTGGKPVAVKGSPHKVVDVDKAPAALEKAFKERAVTGRNEPVRLPGTTSRPKVTDAQLKEAVNGFGRTAMSGWVWLKAGDVEVPFSQKTIGTFLTMRPAGDSGTLQPVIDVEKLQQTYGSAFDNVVIEGGAGTVKMTPKHAAAAMVDALRKKAPAEPAKRVAEVPGAVSR